MRHNKRVQARRPTRYAAWLRDGDNSPRACVIADMSDSGARLEITDTDTLPDRLSLVLDGPDRRELACRVVWRAETEIGVHFGA